MSYCCASAVPTVIADTLSAFLPSALLALPGQLMDVSSVDDVHAQLQQQVDALILATAGPLGACSGRYPEGADGSSSNASTGNQAAGATRGAMPDLEQQQQQQQQVLPWTQKYQPTRAADVCGNADSVQRLSAWLRAWQERMAAEVKQQPEQTVGGSSPARGRGAGRGGGRGRQAKRRHSSDFIVDDSEEDWSEGSDGGWGVGSDSDCERRGRGVASKAGENALALSGPPGCGKTAAAYACAQVIQGDMGLWDM